VRDVAMNTKKHLIKAMLRHCLPLSFSNHCYPKRGSFNGIRFLFVFVEPSFFKELQSLPCLSLEANNLWDYYFIGYGFQEVSEENLDSEVRVGDWTFQGDDIERPILSLRYLEQNPVLRWKDRGLTFIVPEIISLES
jgi:hypothetical protein